MAYGTTDAVVGPRSEEEVTPLTQEEEVEGHVEGAVEVEVEAESDASEGAGATPSSSSSSSSSSLGGKVGKVATFVLFSGAMVSMVTMPQLFGTPFGTKDSTDLSTSMKGVPTLTLDNAHTRRTGRVLGDGMYKRNIAQVHKPTRMALDASSSPVVWKVDGEVLAATPTMEVEHTFTKLGKHTVEAGDYEFTVDSVAVRYEIRDLDDDDREGYFKALRSFYDISQDEGEALYGETYKSSDYLVREHIYGAADMACDHWHDDAGILNHHVAVTWQMEQSLRAIDPTTAAHYWDYTRDAAMDYEWYESDIFGDDWFGTAHPSNKDHILDTGRFAFTKVKTDARGFSNVTNPYGVLRSPWNTNPVPYVLRSNYTNDKAYDGYTSFPSCSEFSDYVGEDLAYVLNALNGQLHGPVHIMIGGQWDLSSKWSSYMNEMTFADNFLLLAKVLWRVGFLRVPDYCSTDTPHSDCVTSCPEEYRNGMNATEIFAAAHLGRDTADSDWLTKLDDYGFTHEDLLDEICHIGSPGEMFTSAAPQDPTFWPLHGNAERFVQYLRLLDEEDIATFNQTWGYHHDSNIPSDTHLVCDWGNQDPAHDLSMPTCIHETCPGHKEDDVLPFTGLFSDQSGLYTNKDMYKFTDPKDTYMPYVYDSLDYWEGCTGGSMLDSAIQHGKLGASASVSGDAAGASSLVNALKSFRERTFDGMYGKKKASSSAASTTMSLSSSSSQPAIVYGTGAGEVPPDAIAQPNGGLEPGR
eukprot:CAMPEP_0119520276 /NCGR_PEP_ID=MMETSP1344-20130328/36331_1 /TAXON_ID=236787 /ORGANISM="Florenciella parvula, Strain CCMP2471" /LENGTH=749 /DNA_ID=CAMNT_0007558145 /DNA_START=116 /DNA_END=2365 /DNA_ORIENTATION=-